MTRETTTVTSVPVPPLSGVSTKESVREGLRRIDIEIISIAVFVDDDRRLTVVGVETQTGAAMAIGLVGNVGEIDGVAGGEAEYRGDQPVIVVVNFERAADAAVSGAESDGAQVVTGKSSLSKPAIFRISVATSGMEETESPSARFLLFDDPAIHRRIAAVAESVRCWLSTGGGVDCGEGCLLNSPPLWMNASLMVEPTSPISSPLF